VRRWRVVTLGLALLLSGCALSHTRGTDGGGVGREDPVLDGSPPDADPRPHPEVPPDPGGPAIRCGPNLCRSGEICCNEECGVCAFPEECVDHGCVGD
jgi:hypothetical protein